MADDQIIDRLIADLNEQPLAADLLVALLSERIIQQNQTQYLNTALKEVQQRWMNNGTPVVTDELGVSRDVTGEAYFDVIDVEGGSAVVNSDNPRQLQLRVGAGADCMFDYLVSPCFSTLPGWTSGQTFTSLSGCTFKTYATVTALWTELNALTTTGTYTVFICGGTYAVQDVPINLDSNVRIHIFGAGMYRTNITSVSTAPGAVIFDVKSTGTSTYWHQLTVGAVAVAYASIYTFKDSTGSGSDLNFEQCSIGGKWGSDLAGCFFDTCRFDQGFTHDFGGNIDTVEFYNCDFGDGNGTTCVNDTQGMKQTIFDSCRFNRKLLFNPTGGSMSVRIAACVLGTGGSVTSNWIHINGNTAGRFIIEGNKFQAPLDANGTIYIQNVDDAFEINIHGNDFAKTTGAAFPFIVSADTAAQGIILGNVFQRDGANRWVEDDGGVSISGNFSRSVFGPNYPGNKASYNITGSNNEFYPTTSASGSSVPTNALVVKDDGSSVVANTASLDFRSGLKVTLDGTTEADIALGDLTAQYDQSGAFDWVYRGGNLLVANSKQLKLYSDNGAGTPTTLKAVWDAATGHIAINNGGGASLDTNILFKSVGAFDGSIAQSAIQTAPTFTLTGNQSALGKSLNLLTAYAGVGFTQSGIQTLAFLQATVGNTTVNDLRGIEAVMAFSSASGVVVDRYGVRIREATGSGSLTNQYGLYIESMAKGGTINRAIQSLGGISTHLGSMRFGSNSAPTNGTASNGIVTAGGFVSPDGALVHSAANQFAGPLVIPAGGAIRFSDADDSNYVGLRSPAVAPAANLVIHLPSDTPSAGEFLKVTAISSPDITTEWAAGGGGASPLTTKGDIYTFTTVDARLAVGANGTILIADSAQATGNAWKARSTTAELANVAATESAGTDTTIPFGDHVHALGIGTTRGDVLAWNSTPVAARIAVGAQYRVFQSDGTDPAWRQSFVVMNLLEGLFLGGPLRAAAASSVANHQGKVIKLPPWATAATLISFNANVNTPPTGATLLFDVCKGTDFTTAPTSLFTTTFPEIATSKNETTETGGSGGNLTGTVAASDRLFFYITQVGSSERGRDLTAMLWAKVYLEY